MGIARAHRGILRVLLAMSVFVTGCEESLTSPDDVDWDAFDRARAPISPRAFVVREGRLVAIGEGRFRPIQDVVAWDRTQWEHRGDGLKVHEPFAVTLFEDDLVLGGEADPAAGDSMAIAVERSSVWRAFAGGMDGPVYALAPLGETLVAGGAFTSAGSSGVPYLARWNGSAWSALSGGVDGIVRSLHAHGDSLLVAGEMTTAGGASVQGLALHTGSSWLALADRPTGPITAITMWNDRPVIGGSFTTTTSRAPSAAGDEPTFSVAVFADGAWTPAGDLDLPGGVAAFAVYRGALFAGGAGGAYRWTGDEWQLVHTASGGTHALVVFRETLIFGDGTGAGSSITRCRTCG